MGVPARGRRTIGLGVLAILLLAVVGPGPANVAAASSVEPSSEAPATAQGEAALLESIAQYFNQKVGEVTPEELKALREKGYGIGEIVMAYGLALAASLVADDGQGTAASTFDEALSKVLQLREAGLGWGEIARGLGVHPSTLGQSVAGAVRQAERKADELYDAARRAGVQAGPKLRQLGEELRRAAASAAESAREILPDPAREHFRRALEELHRGLAAAGGSSGDGTGSAGAGTGKAAGGPPGGGAQDSDQAPTKENKGPGHESASPGQAGKPAKGGG